MNCVQKWTRFSFILMFFCSCLPLFILASPVLSKKGHAPVNHTCVLDKELFEREYFMNRIKTLAKQAELSDTDEHRLIGKNLFTNVPKNNHCYLMMRVTDIVVTNVLSKLKDSNPSVAEVEVFFIDLNMKLRDCKPLDFNNTIENNLEVMKDKLVELGENGKNKVVGELQILCEYLKTACTAPSKDMKNKKHNVLLRC